MAALSALILVFSGDNLVAGLIALFLLILGFALLIPIAVRAAARAMTPLAAKLAGTSGRLAISGVGASLSRTGVAIVALTVAVSATVGVSVMVDSFRSSVSEWLGNTLQSDIYVGVVRGTLDADLVEDLVSVAGIASYSTSRRTWLETEAGRDRLVVLQMAPGSYAGTAIRDGDPDEIWQQFDERGAVLVSDPYAYRHGVGRGDTVRLKTKSGDRVFRIAAVYQSYDANGGAILMSRRTYDIFFDDPAINSIGIYLEDGADIDNVMESFRQVSLGRQSLIMNSNARIRDISLDIFDRTFIITDVLYWLAVGVAIIGILGAMLALQLERGRELGGTTRNRHDARSDGRPGDDSERVHWPLERHRGTSAGPGHGLGSHRGDQSPGVWLANGYDDCSSGPADGVRTGDCRGADWRNISRLPCRERPAGARDARGVM